MVRARLLLLSAAAVCLQAAPVAAQRINSPYRWVEARQYASLFAGKLDTQTGGAGLGPTSGNVFGGEWGYRVSGPFVVALTFGYGPLQRVVRDTLRLTGDTTVFRPVGSPADQRVFTAMAALRFDVTGSRTWYGLQPYLLLGAGGAFSGTGENGADITVPQDVRFKFGTSFAGQAGGGIEWYATRHIGLRLDARGTLWKLHTPQAFLVRDRTLPQSEWAQNTSFSGGLAVHF